ncbi:MAG: septum formation protein Maf [Pseudomonadales bacterium]|nr:septum formation protein Maf [Pseudomonadales bacterium]
MRQIILASSSRYRQQQLKQLNLDFCSIAPDVDESPLKTQISDHIALSQALSRLKADNIKRLHPDAIIIAGDQIASFQQGILSKPITEANAFQQLRKLSGQQHRLISSVVIYADGQEYIHSHIATLQMRKLSDQQIHRYIAQDQPLHSCGAYRIEAQGIALFETLDCEDFSAIVGIPLIWTANTLNQLGIAVP